MKKKLFLGLLAAAAVSFTACQKDEVISEMPQDNAIGFGTYVGRDAQTKASVTNIDVMKEADYPGFGVFAYQTGQTSYSTGQTSFAPTFMYNQQVDYVTNSWTYLPVKYWPNATDKISFFAYAPYGHANISGFASNSTKSDPTFVFTVPNGVNNQVDLLYDNTYGLNRIQTGGQINFTFNHALSRIGFKVNTNVVGNKVTVNTIIVSGLFVNSATFNLASGSFTDPTASATEYRLGYTEQNVTGHATNYSEISANEGYIMIIPKNFGTDDITITVNYDISVYDQNIGGFAPPVNYTKTGSIEDFNFIRGNAYTFNMMLTPDVNSEIKFGVTDVTRWDETTGASDVTWN